MSAILGSFLAINSGLAIASKAVNTKITEPMNEKIISEGLYHVTTKENVEAILKSKYVKPSGYVASYGKKKSFFFGGLPNANDLRKNVYGSLSVYEFDALKIDIKKDEYGNDLPKEDARKILSKFKQRILNDDAISYEGKCLLNDKCCSHVSLVYDFDKDHNIVLREKTQEEIDNGYKPSEEIIEALNISKSKFDNVKSLASLYAYEVKNPIQRVFNMIKDKIFNKNKYLMLESTGSSNEIVNNKPNTNNMKLANSLKEQVVSRDDVIENDISDLVMENTIKEEPQKVQETDFMR